MNIAIHSLMKIRNLFILIALLLTAVTQAQKSGSDVNIRMVNEKFSSFVKQVESQSDLKLYYRTEWFEDRTFTYHADSADLDDALFDLLKGTGLHFNLIDSTRIVILPDGRLNMQLPVLSSATGGYSEMDAVDDYIGVKAGEYLSGTRPKQITQTIEVGTGNGTSSRSIARALILLSTWSGSAILIKFIQGTHKRFSVISL